MNGPQKPQKQNWKDLVEDIKTTVHNAEINLELLRAQLKRAEEHARGS